MYTSSSSIYCNENTQKLSCRHLCFQVGISPACNKYDKKANCTSNHSRNSPWVAVAVSNNRHLLQARPTSVAHLYTATKDSAAGDF